VHQKGKRDLGAGEYKKLQKQRRHTTILMTVAWMVMSRGVFGLGQGMIFKTR